MKRVPFVTLFSVVFALALTLAGCGGSNPDSTILISDANLQAEMNSKLSLELNDATTAKTRSLLGSSGSRVSLRS